MSHPPADAPKSVAGSDRSTESNGAIVTVRNISTPRVQSPPLPAFTPIPPTPYNAPWYDSVADTGEQQTSPFGHHFRTTEQIWDPQFNDWVPFRRPPKKDFGDALFVVNHRRFTRRDDESAFTVVDLLDHRLIEAVRETCQDVENVFSTRPSLNLKTIFPHISRLKLHIEALEASKNEDENQTAEVLKSFLQVVEDEFEESREKLERLLADGKIIFEFLWAVFKPEVCVKARQESSGEFVAAVVDAVEEQANGNIPLFQLRGRTLAWTGTKYEHIPWTHDILTFTGPQNMADLSVTILEDHERAMLTERGRKYTHYAGVCHVHVSGSIIVPSGQAYTNMPAKGRAMIDVVGKCDNSSSDASHVIQAPFMGHGWAMPLQPTYDAFGNAVNSPPPPSAKTANVHLPMEDVPKDMLWLLSPVLRGYSFTAKVWGDIRVKDLEPVVYDEQAWDRLVLDPETKALIRSLVHVRARRDVRMLDDWIKGKGGGLVVLLHGVAGVGKTLTAEAVAELLHRPLYVVGSGELGYKANTVEPALQNCLDLATKWNAVLLIDEADVFLERRADADLMRNALVATFLRLLEYHSGVLFLTTNRVKSFDQAFLSRVSLAVKYAELDIEQRSMIWWQFLNHVIKTASDHPHAAHALLPSDPETDLLHGENIKELAMKPFNGRIIKNIVRTAQALALSSEEPMAMRHLRTVIKVTEKFLHDTETIRNDRNDSDGFDPANEVVSLM